MSKLVNGNFYFPVDGHFISQKQIRINEVLQDYDPNLQLQWIPPNERSQRDAAFRVVHFQPGRPPYLVCIADEADERLLARVFEADQRSSPNRLSYIDNYNNALELTRMKEAAAQREEDHELAASVIRNTKSYYRIKNREGDVIDLERPGRRNSRKTYIW